MTKSERAAIAIPKRLTADQRFYRFIGHPRRQQEEGKSDQPQGLPLTFHVAIAVPESPKQYGTRAAFYGRVDAEAHQRRRAGKEACPKGYRSLDDIPADREVFEKPYPFAVRPDGPVIPLLPIPYSESALGRW
jgi:hypothetical protein